MWIEEYKGRKKCLVCATRKGTMALHFNNDFIIVLCPKHYEELAVAVE